MILADVNVLVYAHREDAAGHEQYRTWLEGVLKGDSAFGVSELVLSGFLRVVTHPRVFKTPTPITTALEFTEVLRDHRNSVLVSPGERHWGIFSAFCRKAGAKGNLVPDAYFAALAVESGCSWITSDRGYGRFPGLSWRHPLEA